MNSSLLFTLPLEFTFVVELVNLLCTEVGIFKFFLEVVEWFTQQFDWLSIEGDTLSGEATILTKLCYHER